MHFPEIIVSDPSIYSKAYREIPGRKRSNPLPQSLPPVMSHFRRVFQTTDQMKAEFVKFLKTIFYQLDEKKTLALMQEILSDPDKTDEQVYTELMTRIGEAKKRFPFLARLWSLFVLKRGLGPQVKELMKPFNNKEFHHYMEIYDRRYVNTIRKVARLPLNGNVIAVCNTDTVDLGDRIQAGAIFSRYPYQTHIPLNEVDCHNPLLEPEKTHTPINAKEVADNSIDLIACLGGLHHIPEDRVEPFVQSMHRTLAPGGVILLRDHNVTDNAGPGNLLRDEMWSIASVVHSFVNAADGQSWDVESAEIREFKSVAEWTELMKKHGFTPISPKLLVLKDDPTENGMFAFVKTPQTKQEFKQAIGYRNDCTRPREGTRATWIEWGNVRYSKAYADYTQNHHAYAFDFIGHMRQHWTHFYYFVKESLQDKKVSLVHSIFSDAMLMNLFIVIGASLQCGLNSLTTFPSRTLARWKHGENWRDVVNLTDMEKLEAKFTKQYSDDLDRIPFYLQDHVGKIKEVWKTLWNSQESWMIKFVSTFSAMTNTLGFLAMGAVSVPLAAIYTQDAYREPETVKILIQDDLDEIDDVIAQWEKEKDPELDKNSKIEVIYQTHGYKLVSVPRYRPFTKIFGYLDESDIQVFRVGNQKEISCDLLVGKDFVDPKITGVRKVYEMPNLQDPEEKRYVTYQIEVRELKLFQEIVGKENIHYIHE